MAKHILLVKGLILMLLALDMEQNMHTRLQAKYKASGLNFPGRIALL